MNYPLTEALPISDRRVRHVQDSLLAIPFNTIISYTSYLFLKRRDTRLSVLQVSLQFVF